MAEQKYISKKTPRYHDMDYEWLRKKGIEYLQQMASGIWTDYNTHDPGVTLLELLCYAITDLGYRCEHDVEDILASDPQNKIGTAPDFFAAHEILPSQPLTVFDFRKKLIDLPWIRNAWLEPSTESEQQLWFDPIHNSLSYQEKNDQGKTNQAISLNGLYKVWIEFTKDPSIGDLNSAEIKFDFEINDESKNYPVHAAIRFPEYYEVDTHWKKPLEITGIKVQLAKSTVEGYDLTAQVKVTFGEEQTEVLNLEIAIYSGNFNWKDKEEQVKKKIREKIKDKDEGLLPVFNKKIITILEHLIKTKIVLNGNRNLCEDYYSIQLIKKQKIGIEAKIEISLDSDPHQLLAKALFDIQQFLDPSIRFYSLQELLAEGLSTEEIFEGPLLKHGFIKDEDLKAFRQCRTLYVSDIFNLFLSSNPAKIKYVTDFKMSSYVDHLRISEANSNLLKLHQSDTYKPRISVFKSSIICTKQEEEIEVDPYKVSILLEEMMQQSEPLKKEEIKKSLDISPGTDRQIVDYASIMEDLPPVYASGKGTLAESASPLRKAQAKQLKGYLLFFEQLLVNFLAQLSNVKNILSMDDEVAQTYFEQTVYQTPDVLQLLKDFVQAQPDMNDKEAVKQAWELFKANTSNDYVQNLRTISEEEKVFLDRRSRFLEHLMARFNENFTDYSLLLYAQNQQQIPQELIDDKASFLQEFPELSSGRATANIFDPSQPYWDTTFVSGLKKMLSRKIGFENYNRRYLTAGAYGFVQFYQEKDLDIISEYRFRILDKENNILLSSTKHYDVIEDGYEVVYKVIEKGKSNEYYEILESSNQKFYFNLYDDDHNILARRIELFETEEDAKNAVEAVIQFMNDVFVDVDKEPEEGFFILENILLRPRYNQLIEGELISDSLMPVLRDDFGNLTEEGKDPYSFRIVAIFPSQLEKFKDLSFKALVERILRLETPAHVMPAVFFVNNLQLSRFERAYNRWLELYLIPVPEDPQNKKDHLMNLSKATHELIGALQFIPPEPDL